MDTPPIADGKPEIHWLSHLIELWEARDYTKALSSAVTPKGILDVLIAADGAQKVPGGYIAGGDTTLRERVTFPKLPKAARRAILTKLNSMPEGALYKDMIQHKGLWIVILRYCHVWQYSGIERLQGVVTALHNKEEVL